MRILYDIGSMFGGGGGSSGGGGKSGGSSIPILGEAAQIYSTLEERNAANDIYQYQMAAAQRARDLLVKTLDPEAVDQLATKFDERRAQRREDFLKEFDPKLYELRENAKDKLLDGAKETPQQDQSHILANQLFKETKDENPALTKLKNNIIDAAQKDLDAGANLSPEYQAELVRAGLKAGGGSGVGLSQGAIGGGVARLLGVAGEQLKASRVAEAQTLAKTGQDLISARANILSTVFPKLRDLEISDRNEAVQNFQLTGVNTPDIGIGGTDAVNTKLAQTNAKTGFIQRRADLRGGRAKMYADTNGAIAGASANIIGDVIMAAAGGGAFGSLGGAAGGAGGLGGGATGAASQGMNWGKFLGNIIGSNGAGTVPYIGGGNTNNNPLPQYGGYGNGLGVSY